MAESREPSKESPDEVRPRAGWWEQRCSSLGPAGTTSSAAAALCPAARPAPTSSAACAPPAGTGGDASLAGQACDRAAACGQRDPPGGAGVQARGARPAVGGLAPAAHAGGGDHHNRGVGGPPFRATQHDLLQSGPGLCVCLGVCGPGDGGPLLLPGAPDAPAALVRCCAGRMRCSAAAGRVRKRRGWPRRAYSSLPATCRDTRRKSLALNAAVLIVLGVRVRVNRDVLQRPSETNR